MEEGQQPVEYGKKLQQQLGLQQQLTLTRLKEQFSEGQRILIILCNGSSNGSSVMKCFFLSLRVSVKHSAHHCHSLSSCPITVMGGDQLSHLTIQVLNNNNTATLKAMC